MVCVHLAASPYNRAMVLLAGLDLAWTATHETGVCLIEHDGFTTRLLRLDAVVLSPAEFAAMLGIHGPVVAAIDAPLIVGPARTAERQLGTVYGRFKASAHSANRALLESTGRMAGPRLAGELLGLGFELDPRALPPGSPRRHALEVYPHAAHVALFGLRERIPYKRKRGRSVAFVRSQLCCYQQLLAGLVAETMPVLAAEPRLQAVLGPAATAAGGTALKRLEDQLDAVTCALVAFLAWRDGGDRLELFGDVTQGHIAVPRRATSGRAPSSP